MEATKCLKPSDSSHVFVAAYTLARSFVSERWAILEEDDVQADTAVVPGKADTDG
jgi:hypothetical protein